MQTALRHKQEQFLILLVNEGFSPVDAYREAYPNVTLHSARSASKRLLSDVAIQKRKGELEALKRAASLISVDFLTKEMLETARLARASGQHNACQAALMGVAKMHGLLIDKQQVEMLVRRPSASPDSPDDMSEALWLEQFGALVIEHDAQTNIQDVDQVDQVDQGQALQVDQVSPGEQRNKS